MYRIALAIRYLRKRRIAYFAVGAVALCVAMVLVVHSVMSGFLDVVRSSSRSLLGDIILEIGGMESFPYYEEFIADLQREMSPQVAAATPVIISAGLLKMLGDIGEDRTRLVVVTGVQLETYKRINSFGKGLFYDTYYPGTTSFDPAPMPTWYWSDTGEPLLPQAYEEALAEYIARHGPPGPEVDAWRRIPRPVPGYFLEAGADQADPQARGEPHPGIILGIEMVAYRDETGKFNRMVPKGSLARLTVLTLTRGGTVPVDPTAVAALRYVDDSTTKIYDIDKQTVYTDFAWLQALLGYDAQERVDGSGITPPRATQIQIKLADGVDYRQARVQVEQVWQRFMDRIAPVCDPSDYYKMQYMLIQTWEERNDAFIRAVEKERILMVILFAIISIVAVLLIGCIFYMIVQEKTRDIGIVRSLGATARGVASVFLVYAVGVGVVGSAIGATGGALFVRYINEFQDLLARLDPSLRVWSPETYSFDRIPNTVRWFDAGVIVVIAILASVVGSLAAARKAAKIWPVDAIRYE